MLKQKTMVLRLIMCGFVIDGLWETDYAHQYLIYNGPDGPVYGSCNVHNVNTCQYVMCTLCRYVDYNHRYNVQFVSSTHSSCPLSNQ